MDPPSAAAQDGRHVHSLRSSPGAFPALSSFFLAPILIEGRVFAADTREPSGPVAVKQAVNELLSCVFSTSCTQRVPLSSRVGLLHADRNPFNIS